MLAQRKPRPTLLTSESYAEIDRWLAKYPPERKQSAVMAALTIAQDQNGGWLTSELVNEIADYLEMPAVAVQEVATFYSMYEHKPVGQHKICVCTNVSCMLCDSERIVKHLQQKLGIGFGQITPDGKFSLKEVECLGACVNAPMMLIGKTYYENLTPEKIDDILARLN
jgi:NADH-quinone oxidoreductase subunit E